MHGDGQQPLLLDLLVGVADQARHAAQVHQPADAQAAKGEEVEESPGRPVQVEVMEAQEAQWEGQHIGVIQVAPSGQQGATQRHYPAGWPVV